MPHTLRSPNATSSQRCCNRPFSLLLSIARIKLHEDFTKADRVKPFCVLKEAGKARMSIGLLKKKVGIILHEHPTNPLLETLSKMAKQPIPKLRKRARTAMYLVLHFQ